MVGVNDRNDQTKLLWLEVRLVCKARKAWNCLTTTTQLSLLFDYALSQRADEISTLQSSRPMGGSQKNLGGEIANNLQSLDDKAFLDLDELAKEVDCYLTLLEKPDVSFAVRQCCPKTLNDGVSATLEIEAFMSLGNQRGYQTPELTPTSTVASVDSPINATFPSKENKMYEMLQILVSRMNQMELTIARMDNRSSDLTNSPRLAKGQK